MAAVARPRGAVRLTAARRRRGRDHRGAAALPHGRRAGAYGAAVADLPDGVVDLVGIGPVFPSPTKPEGPAMGLTGLAGLTGAARRVHDEHDRPVASVAIGGIDASNAAAVLDTGVDGLAVSAAIVRAADPAAATAALRGIVDGRRV